MNDRQLDWKRRRERSTPWMLEIIAWIALRLGRGTARALLWPIVVYFALTSGDGRSASRRFLSAALARPATAIDVFRQFHAFAACMLDRVYLLKGRQHLIHIERHGGEQALAHVHAGGTLLLTAHLGSFDVLRIFGLDRYALRFRIVMDRQHAPMITALLERLNPTLAAEIIDSRAGPALALTLRAALDQHCVVGMMADRCMPGDPGVTVPFMGHLARLPTTPWRWASVLDAPVLLCFGLYRGGNRYDLHFEIFSEASTRIPRGERARYVETCARRYAGRLEHYARLAPYNWFNFYDFWCDDAARN